MKADHWICQTCKGPLRDDGTITIYNANSQLGEVGSYPVEASPDINAATTTDAYRVATHPDIATIGEIAAAQSQGALWLLNRPKNIEFGAFHADCDPFAKLTSYAIVPPRDLEGWICQVLHLQEKCWMGRWDLMRMLRFWWSHRGEEAPEFS